MARCDGVKLQYFLFQFLLNFAQKSCNYHAPSFSVAAWRPRRHFWPATFWCSFMPLLWTIIIQWSYELEWILGSSGSDKGISAPPWRIWPESFSPPEDWSVFASFVLDAWTVLQNPARSKDVFGQFWQWRQWSSALKKGLDTWTNKGLQGCTDRQWRRVKRENTKTAWVLRRNLGGRQPLYNITKYICVMVLYNVDAKNGTSRCQSCSRKCQTFISRRPKWAVILYTTFLICEAYSRPIWCAYACPGKAPWEGIPKHFYSSFQSGLFTINNYKYTPEKFRLNLRMFQKMVF